MSDYLNKFASIAAKKQKLLEEEAKLIEKRRQEISDVIERHGLLTLSDEVLSGLFLEASKAFHEKSSRLKEWETEGARFLKSKKQNAAVA